VPRLLVLTLLALELWVRGRLGLERVGLRRMFREMLLQRQLAQELVPLGWLLLLLEVVLLEMLGRLTAPEMPWVGVRQVLGGLPWIFRTGRYPVAWAF
jgi:hypothetical protein